MKRSRGGSRPQVWTAAFAVLVLALLLMACGYHVGTNSAASVFKAIEAKLTNEETHLRDAERQCADSRSALMKDWSARLDSQLRMTHNASKADHHALQNAYDRATEAERSCAEGYDRLMDSLGDTMRKAQSRRENLTTQRALTGENYARLHSLTHGDGPAAIAIAQDIQALYKQYVEACTASPGCVVAPLITNASSVELGSELSVNTTALDEAYAAQLPRDFDPRGARAQRLLFPPVAGHDGKASGPTYFDRGESEDAAPAKGPKAPVTLPHGLMTHIYDAVDAALCAYGLSNKNVTVENAFYFDPLAELEGLAHQATDLAGNASHTAASPSRLNELIATPLLRFCEGCDTSEWDGLCTSFASYHARRYGSLDYWVVRSMIRAGPAIRAAADRFWERHDAATTLAVVAQVQPTYTHECIRATFNTSRGNHYVYMRTMPRARQRAAGDGAALLSLRGRSAFAECSTSPVDLVDAILRVAAVDNPSSIYLDVPRTLALDVLTVLEKRDPSWVSRVIQRPDASLSNAASDELLSHEIASRARHLLVSPYLSTSRYVVENYLLRHQFNPAGSVWYL